MVKELENNENKCYNTKNDERWSKNMNKEICLILLDGKEKTNEIKNVSMNEKYYNIEFYNSEKKYNYNFSKVLIEKRTGILLIKENQIVLLNDIIFSNVDKILKYETKIRLIFKDKTEKIADASKLNIIENNNLSTENEILKYFKDISKYVKMVDQKTGKEEYLLKEQYKDFSVQEKSVLKYYLNGIAKEKKETKRINIYPFNFNKSQKMAVENIYKNNISVIKGPPGTGKTQTILNIISNLVADNKTIAVVSGNNEATKNVKEKLDKNGYGFIVAELGNSDNVKEFFNNLPEININRFNKQEVNGDIYQNLLETTNSLDKLLELNNEENELKIKLNNYKLEQKYFEEYYKNQEIDDLDTNDLNKMNSSKIIDFLAYSRLAKEKIYNIK